MIVMNAKQKVISLVAVGFLFLMSVMYMSNNLLFKPVTVEEKWMINEKVLNSQDHMSKQYSQDDKLQLLRENSVSDSKNLSTLDIDAMSDLQVKLTLHSVLDNTEVVCSRKLRLGNLGDGGWEICDDSKVRPAKDCVVYSFGINYDFSFDDYVAKTYGCHVHSFDPSMDDETHKRSDLVNFYKIGISNRSETDSHGWTLNTLGNIRKLLGHSDRPIDVIKMDVEYAEWIALPEMLKSGDLKGVKQFLVEYHTLQPSDSYYKKMMPSVHIKDRDETRNRLKTVKALQTAGFRVFYPHKNEHCDMDVFGFASRTTSCYEVHYMNPNWNN